MRAVPACGKSSPSPESAPQEATSASLYDFCFRGFARMYCLYVESSQSSASSTDEFRETASRVLRYCRGVAWRFVQSRAVSSYFCLFLSYIFAISGTSGSRGFGSQSREQMESSTLEMVSAGLHWLLRISRQIPARTSHVTSLCVRIGTNTTLSDTTLVKQLPCRHQTGCKPSHLHSPRCLGGTPL